MPLTCALIASSQVIDCDDKPVAGLDNFLYLFNLSDKATTPETLGTITAITTLAVNQMFKWEGGNNFVNGTYATVVGNVLNSFTHTLTITAPNDAQLGLNEIQNMANARVIGCVAKFGDLTPTVRMYGRVHGMVGDVVGDESSEDNDGLPLVTLSTPPGKREPKLPQHVLSTDYPGTITMLDALL